MTRTAADPYADQMAAALGHTVAVRAQIHGLLGPARPGRMTKPIARIIGAFLASVRPGCEHVRPESPRPYVATAWHRGRVTCGPCSVTEQVCPPGDEHLCDGCGRHRVGELVIGTVQIGLVILHYGLCARCAAGSVSSTSSTRPGNRRERRARRNGRGGGAR